MSASFERLVEIDEHDDASLGGAAAQSDDEQRRAYLQEAYRLGRNF